MVKGTRPCGVCDHYGGEAISAQIKLNTCIFGYSCGKGMQFDAQGSRRGSNCGDHEAVTVAAIARMMIVWPVKMNAVCDGGA